MKKKQHILLTTMSTFPPNYKAANKNNGILTPNYYRVVINNQMQYCTGILQTEAGSKYFLATEPYLDKIIAIVSPETISNGGSGKEYEQDIPFIPNLADYVDVAKDLIASQKSLSPYGYYAYRIGQFLRQTDDYRKTKFPLPTDTELNNLVATIKSQERVSELEALADRIMKEAGLTDPGLWFHRIDAEMISPKDKNLLFTKIKDAIKEDFNKQYISRDEYPKYLGSIDSSLETLEIDKSLRDLKGKLEVTNEDLSNLKETIKSLEEEVVKKYSFKAFAKELWLKLLQSTLETKISDMEKEITSQKAAVYEKLITALKDTIARLIHEIEDLKTNRQKQEQNYIKSYLYSRLDGSYRLKPQSSDQNISLEYVKDKISIGSDENGKKDEIPNITGIIDRICPEGTEDDIYLYIDMQGGSRTQGYVLNAVLTILNNESTNKVHIRKIVTTSFERNQFSSEIVDETKRYRIVDLASGMNAFIQYGRADQIRSYFDTVYGDLSSSHPQIKHLLDDMEDVDHSLSICDIGKLGKAIEDIHSIFSQKYDITDEYSGIFKTMLTIIQQDYKQLVNDTDPAKIKIDYIALTRWAYEKHFTQEALTIIESKIPEILSKKGILFYCSESESPENIYEKLYDDLIDKIKSLDQTKKKRSGKSLTKVTWDAKTELPWQFNEISHYIFKFYPQEHKNDIKNCNKNKTIKAFCKNYPIKYTDSSWHCVSLIKPLLTDHSNNKLIHLSSTIKILENANINTITKLLFLYYYIANIRNEVNHSSDSSRIDYKDITNIIGDFLKLLEDAEKLLPNSPASSKVLDFDEFKLWAIKKHNNSLLLHP